MRESQGNPCQQRDMIIMIYMCVCVCVSNFFLVGSGSSIIQMESLYYLTPPRQSSNGFSVMYHGQAMFASVLTVKQNDPVTLSKHDATCKKREQRNFVFLEYRGIIKKILKNSSTRQWI